MKFIAAIVFAIGLIPALVMAADQKQVARPAPKPTAQRPTFSPANGESKDKYTVTLTSATPGAIIRYSLDGATPNPETGKVYSDPIVIDHTATLVAVAYKEGLPPSPASWGTYIVGEGLKPGLTTFHIGNSLTGTAGRFGMYAKAAGYDHTQINFLRGGILTKRLWDNEVMTEKKSWAATFDKITRIDIFSVQPRDFIIEEEAGYDVKFFDLVRAKAPEMQPWIYVEWVERDRSRWSDQGAVPSAQVKTQWPAMTWEESMSAMLLYGEELQKKLKETYKEGKQPRILPSGIAMGWIDNMIERGQMPGMPPGSFNKILFGGDGVHPNANGAFLVDCTWFSAFYKQSPEGKVPPISTDLTSEQAAIMQRLAWDVVKNYPDCGLYEEGKTPTDKPQFEPAPTAITDITPIRLSSATPGAWFRYTLDGTTPTRTRGIVYCGVISVRPGMTVKAVAFKSGMADSEAADATYAGGSRNRVLVARKDLAAGAVQPFNLSTAGPFAQYLCANGDRKPDDKLHADVLSVAPTGQTLWLGGRIRRDAENDSAMEIVLGSQGSNHPIPGVDVAAGYAGKEFNDGQGKRYWGLHVGDKFVRSDVPIETGKPALLVLKLEFDRDSDGPIHLSLYVNPLLGEHPPAAPAASAEIPPHFEWRTVGIHAGENSRSALEDLRVGESFAAVTPKTP